MSPESVALFTTAGALLLAALVMYTVWITVIPMLEGDKKKKRLESVASARETLRNDRL